MRHVTLPLLLSLILVSTAWAQRTYTLDADFDEGVLTGVNHDAPNNDQLQLNEGRASFPFVNVAASARGTIVRIHTETGAILGEFLTSPNGQPRNPSRTTVDRFGNVWVGNRAAFINLPNVGTRGSLTRVGLIVGGTRVNLDGTPNPTGDYLMGPFDYNTCQDRDSDGMIKTSRGLGDIRPWTNAGGANTLGGVSTAQDECIINYVIAGSPATRTIAIDKDNNVIVSGTAGRIHEKVIVSGFSATRDPGFSAGTGACGGYGGFIDGNNVLWSMTSGSSYFRYDLNTNTGGCIGLTNYGTGINPATGEVWISQLSGFPVHKVAPNGTLLSSHNHAVSNAQGVVVDGTNSVWVTHSLFRGAGVSRLNATTGQLIGSVEFPFGGRGTTGVSVDAAGKIWVANVNSNNAMRIDPTLGALGADGVTPVGRVDLVVNLGAGAGPYNYSDMTGSVIAGTTAPSGTWTVIHDGGTPGTPWSDVSWNGSTPGGSTITVEVRSSDTVAGLASEAYAPVGNGAPLAGVMGRYIQIQTTLARGPSDPTPVLFDLTVSPVVINACLDPSDDPSYLGGYVLNADGNRAFVRVSAPRGAEQARFYNTANLIIGDPETNPEDGVAVPYDTRTGDTFDFSSDPTALYFPVTTAGGGTKVSFFLEITDACGSVDVDPSFEIASMEDRLALDANRPNPFSHETVIRFTLPEAGPVTLSVYDVLGREVARLADGLHAAGEHSVTLDARLLPAGQYLYRLVAAGTVQTRIMTLAR